MTVPVLLELLLCHSRAWLPREESRSFPTSQRELRNHASRILRQVEAGERMRITVDGRPVADLVPIAGVRRTFVPIDEVLRLIARTARPEILARYRRRGRREDIVKLRDSAEF